MEYLRPAAVVSIICSLTHLPLLPQGLVYRTGLASVHSEMNKMVLYGSSSLLPWQWGSHNGIEQDKHG